MIQDKITRFRDILDKTLKSDKQRKYANDLLDAIVKELNYREGLIKNLVEKLNNDNPDEYQNELEKVGDILLAMGFGIIEFNSFQKGAILLLIKEQKKLKRQLTAADLRKINNIYNCYKDQFNREPESLKELNKIYENVRS